ncbi:MAG: glycosyltransferase [Nitrospirae bacterium]|nr:glycosyltransferase [Nitrospirota bacterium]MBF0554105.1 glycosyltransferase [Nitrospirota bacterium]
MKNSKEINNARDIVSVIIPSYNSAKFICEALYSVINQTYEQIELIIADNHSTDGTEEIIKSFMKNDHRIKYLKIHNNGVIAKSRNMAIQASQGQFVAFLDSDDKWENNKLQKVMTCFRDNPHIDMICHDEWHIDQYGKILKVGRCGPHKTYADLLFKGNGISTSAVVVRMDKLLKVGLFCERTDFVTAEDYELWLRFSKECNIEYLHQKLGYWRIHPNSLSSRTIAHMANVLNVVTHHFDQISHKKKHYYFQMKKRKAGLEMAIGRMLLKEGDFESARPYLLHSFIYYPFSFKGLVLLGACMLRQRI